MGLATGIGVGIQFSRGGGESWDTATNYISALSVTTTSASEQTVTATISGTDYDGVSFEYSTDYGITFVEHGTSATGTYLVTGLTEVTEYYWRARLYKGSNYSAYCAAASDVTYPAFLLDGKSDPWIKPYLEDTVTKDGSNRISQINDINGSGHNFVQAGSDGIKPTWSEQGASFLSTSAQYIPITITKAQPISIYAVVKNNVFTTDQQWWASKLPAYYRSNLKSTNTAGGLAIICADAWKCANSQPNLKTFNIIDTLQSGANSFLRVNNVKGLVENPGTAGFTSFELGGSTGYGSYFSGTFREFIIRANADSDADREKAYNYFRLKHKEYFVDLEKVEIEDTGRCDLVATFSTDLDPTKVPLPADNTLRYFENGVQGTTPASITIIGKTVRIRTVLPIADGTIIAEYATLVANREIQNLKGVFARIGSKGVTLGYTPIAFNKPKLTFSFDNNDITWQNTGFNYFNAKNLKATWYVVGPTVGTTGFVTWANLLSAHNSGQDIQCHSYTHPDFSALTDQQILDELDNNAALFVANGLPSPQHFAYPSGWGQNIKHVQEVIATRRLSARAYYDIAGIAKFYCYYKNGNKYSIPSWRIDRMTGWDITKIYAIMDIAAANNTNVNLIGHGISTVSGTHPDDLDALIAYAITKGFDIISISELYALMTT